MFAKVLTAGACLLPLALASDARAQLTANPPGGGIPAGQPGGGGISANPPAGGVRAGAPGGGAARQLTSKELHRHLARGAGWIQIDQGNRGVRHGTGWILDREQKLMVTNDHVVAGYDEVTVTFPIWKDGKLVTSEAEYTRAPKVKATVIDRDANRDLALIKVESIPEGMHELKLAANEPDEGDEIRMIGGFTNGGDGLVWGAVTGVVRACGPQAMNPDKQRRSVPVREVLSDARSNGGNSGAPVVNSAGEVVAVHFAYKPWANGVARHVSVVELKAYLKESLPLVEPKTGAEFLTRAKRRLGAGRIDTAIADASAALSMEPKLVAAMMVRGQAFLAKKDAPTAIADFDDALKHEPNNYDLRLARGRAYRAAGKPVDALSDFAAAIRTDPAKPTAYNERGLTHYFGGKFADAETDFGRAIDADTKDAILWANRADARLRQNKFADSAADWAKAAELAPWSAWYFDRFGYTLGLTGQHGDEAIKAHSRAVELSGGAAFYCSNLAKALERAGKHDDAVKMFTKAIDARKALEASGAKLAPAETAADYSGRGNCRVLLNHFKEAVDDLTKAIELTDRKHAFYFIQRAIALDGMGDKAAAAADRETAAKLGGAAPKPVEKLKADVDSFVGTWVGNYAANGVRVNEVVTLRADGTFDATFTITGFNGTERIKETGTWSATKAKLTFTGKKIGTVTRTYERTDDEITLDVEEYGIVVTFVKKK
jgi:tetratricopeptide (TPR) repeat protein